VFRNPKKPSRGQRRRASCLWHARLSRVWPWQSKKNTSVCPKCRKRYPSNITYAEMLLARPEI
jgi:hypothetical protein